MDKIFTKNNYNYADSKNGTGKLYFPIPFLLLCFYFSSLILSIEAKFLLV